MANREPKKLTEQHKTLNIENTCAAIQIIQEKKIPLEDKLKIIKNYLK